MPDPIIPIPGSGPGTTGPVTPQLPLGQPEPIDKPPKAGKPDDGHKPLSPLLQKKALEYVPTYRRVIAV